MGISLKLKSCVSLMSGFEFGIKFKHILGFALSLFFSYHALAAQNYECADDSKENPVGVKYLLSVEDTKVNGTDVFTYNLEVVRKNGDLRSKSSGLGSIQEDFLNGEAITKSYILLDRSELQFLVKDSKIRFIKRFPSGAAGGFTDCMIK